jgi:hypothetical protein
MSDKLTPISDKYFLVGYPRKTDRAGMPDLSVRWIILIGGGDDSRDPTTNETGRGALAIAEPTPNGY